VNPFSVPLYWFLLVVGFVFTLARFPPRWQRETRLFHEQTWGCRAVALVLAAVYALILLIPLALTRRALPGWAWVGLFSAYPLFLLVPVAYIVRVREHRPFRSLGLAGDRAVSPTAAAIASYFGLVALLAAHRYATGTGWDTLYSGRIVSDPSRASTWGLLLGLAVIVGVSCAEEIIYRGFALLPVARVVGPVAAIGLTAFAWGLAHIDRAGHDRIRIFLLGLALGWVFYHTESLYPVMAFHVLVNLGSFSDVLFSRLPAAGIHWTNEEHFRYIGGGSLVLALAAAGVAIALRRRRPQPWTA
jgi:membrane protease YdiL (CAAX protease family)